MPVVEVSCPTCGVKLKAPDTMAGKKAKCKKCGNPFRIPGGSSSADDGDKTEALAAPPPAAPPAPRPAKDMAALPSADAFDFGKGAAPAAPARSTFGAKPAPAPAPKPAAPPAPAAKSSGTVPAPAQARSAPAAAPAPAKPASKPAAPALPPEPAPPPAGDEEEDDRFAFTDAPGKPRKKRDDDDEDEPKAKKKKSRDEDDDEEAPKKKKKRDEDDEDEDDEPKGKKKTAAEEQEPYNPFADYDAGPAGEAPPPKALWDDEDPKGKKKKKKGDDEDDPKGKKKRKGDEGGDEDDEKEKPRYRRPQEKGGMGMALIITAVIGLFALGLGVTSVVVYVKQVRKDKELKEEQARKEQEEKEKKLREEQGGPPEVPGVPPAAPGAPGAPAGAPKEKGPDPKKEPEPKEPDTAPGMTRPAANITRTKPIAVGNLSAKPELTDKPGAGMVLGAAAASVKRVFPPNDPKTGDTAVLIQSSPPVAGLGTGEKLALDFYGPSGNRVDADRIEYGGDGLANPIADFTATPDKKAYFLAATGGKLHIWSVPDKAKVLDGVSPYADKPEHAKSGLAAAFFTADPNRVILVSTAGAVLLYDVPTKKPVKDFIPPNGAIGRVSLGASVAKAEGGGSVALAVGGVLYQVKADPSLAVVQKYDLGGDVYRSMGIAVVGTPGRIVYACEARADGKKDTVVIGLPAGTGAKPTAVYRFPTAAAGEPRAALWAGDNFAGVATDRGVLWFDDHDKKFLPMLLTQPGTAGQYFGDDKFFWYVIPNPKEEGKSVLAALPMPLEAFENYSKKFTANQPLTVAKIDAKGLSK